MLLWWDGLTMIEKRIPSNKDTLIRTAEIAFLSQATAGSTLSGNAGAANAKSDSKANNDRQKSDDNQKSEK